MTTKTKTRTPKAPDPYDRNPPFTLRIADADLLLIRDAAEATGRSVSGYVRHQAITAARNDLKKSRKTA